MNDHGRTTINPGTDADARGRNGVFRPAYIEIQPLEPKSVAQVSITASSKVMADLPPLALRLNVLDAELLIKAIEAALAEIYEVRAQPYERIQKAKAARIDGQQMREGKPVGLSVRRPPEVT